jgi:hypothetical protein
MYYDGTDGSHEDTGLAYSTDGLNWSAYTGNPVLSGSSVGAWDCYSSVYGTVYRDSAGFHYFYSGKGQDDGSGNCIASSNFDGIGYASSTGGETWVKDLSPIFTISDGEQRIYTPAVINDGSGILRMYFSIQNSVGVKEIAYATLKSDNADLAGLSLSSGTLSPAFDPATTAYTASVDNSVTDVTATESTNPGANAAPDSSGTVDASVQSPAGAAEVVTTSWGPGTFTTPVTVTLTPESQNTPVAGGFTVGDTTIQLTVTDGSGTKVTSFLKPIIIHIPAGAVSGVPAYSEDGITWVLIPELATPSLPDGQPDGYYLNADGSVDIYTRHATLFGLLKDTQAPTAPTLKARVSGNKLYLLLKGAKDNVRVAGYQVLFNGHRLKTTLHGYLVLPARAGRFQVTAIDTAGNKSKPSAAVKVVRRKRGFDIVKS